MKISFEAIPDLNPKDLRRKSKFLFLRIKWHWRKHKQQILLGVVLVVSLSYIFWGMPPRNFPVGAVIEIEEGATLNEVAKDLKSREVIKSINMFKAFIMLQGGNVIAGDYFFSEPEDVIRSSHIIATGDYGLIPLSITIPEGATVVEMALLYERILGGFDAEKFVEQALSFEGYLFPDTYFFLPNVKEEEIIRVMKENFVTRISEIQDEIDAFDKPIGDIVIMASLLEEEARTFETRRMISGILWNRINIGMKLQVDAVFPYILGKNTFQVTLDDLAFDSPYNTYKYEGLPFGPISNPGLRSLRATVLPKESNFIFYLSDLSGNMHYAQTFEEHKINKARYLD